MRVHMYSVGGIVYVHVFIYFFFVFDAGSYPILEVLKCVYEYYHIIQCMCLERSVNPANVI